MFKINHKNITDAMFILVIIIASFASLAHVRGFWLITNSDFWATCLAVSTGLGIIGSMLAMRYTKWTIVSFFIIIIMELIGNIYHSFSHVDIDSQSFILFRDMTQPIFEMLYTVEEGATLPDVIYKRWIAIIEGAFIPLLVVVMFHIWTIVYDSKNQVDIQLRESNIKNLENIPPSESSVLERPARKIRKKRTTSQQNGVVIEIESDDEELTIDSEELQQNVVDTQAVVMQSEDIQKSIEDDDISTTVTVEQSGLVDDEDMNNAIINELVEEDEKKNLTI